MEKGKLYFVATLSFGNDSLLGIRIAPGLKIEKWSTNKATKIMSESSCFDKYTTFQILTTKFCLDEKEKHVYVVAGSYNPEDDKPLYPLDIRRVKTEGFGGYLLKTEDTFKLMRLFKEGSIDISNIYIYSKEKRKIVPIYDCEREIISPSIEYHLSKDERIELEAFLKQYTLPFSESYIQLAIENFDESYQSNNINLAFLSLMIASEILFNDGNNELTYRISRGMAVLLGKDKPECRQIYEHMKKLYKKRSNLVHTGKASISLEDVIILRNLLRLSIKKLLLLGLSKAELSSRLLEQGFGQDFET